MKKYNTESAIIRHILRVIKSIYLKYNLSLEELKIIKKSEKILLKLARKIDKLTKQIYDLNKIYDSFKKNFVDLEKMFKDVSSILSKVDLSKRFVDDIYRGILEHFESIEITKKFNDIVKDIKNENKKTNRE